MKYLLIQIAEPSLGFRNSVKPCFRLYNTFESIDDAIEAREKTKHEDWFIIIQGW